MSAPRSLYKVLSDPNLILISFNLFALVFLFISSFGTPFNNISLLNADVWDTTDVKTVAIGIFGFCQKTSGLETCSSPSIGYRVDLPLDVGITAAPMHPSAIVHALFLHVVAFALSLVGLPAMSIFLGKFRKPLFFRFTIFVGITALVAFIIDLVLFFSIQKTLAGNGTVAIGIGTWFTLVACMMLLVGGCLFKVLANRTSRDDLMLNQGRSDIELLRHTLLKTLGSHSQQSQRLSETGNTPTPIREIVTSSFNTVENRQPSSGQSQIIEDEDESIPRPSTDNQKLRGILVKKFVPSIDSSKPARSPLASPSGYAPSSYRTYRSSSVFSTQTAENLSAELLDIPLSRASSNVHPASTRETSRRSTVDLGRALSWTSARSRSRSKRPHKVDAILRAMPSTSTLSSFIHDLPPVPRVESAYHPYSIFTTGRGRVAVPPVPVPSGHRQELATGSDLAGPLKALPFDGDATIIGQNSLDDYSGSRAPSVASVKTQFASNIA